MARCLCGFSKWGNIPHPWHVWVDKDSESKKFIVCAQIICTKKRMCSMCDK